MGQRQTLKRGGQYQIIPLHEVAEEMYKSEPAGSTTPEKIFDRRWATLLVEAVRARLKAEYSKKADLFAKLEPGLTGELNDGWYANIAKELDMNEGAVRVACIGCAEDSANCCARKLRKPSPATRRWTRSCGICSRR